MAAHVTGRLPLFDSGLGLRPLESRIEKRRCAVDVLSCCRCLGLRKPTTLRKVAAATGLGVRGDARFALAACVWWRGRAREAKGVLSTRCHIGGSAAATVRHARSSQPVVCDARVNGGLYKWTFRRCTWHFEATRSSLPSGVAYGSACGARAALARKTL